MKQRLILAALAVIFSAMMLLFPLHSSLQAQVATIDQTSLMLTIGPLLYPRQTLTAEANGVLQTTLLAQSSQHHGDVSRFSPGERFHATRAIHAPLQQGR